MNPRPPPHEGKVKIKFIEIKTGNAKLNGNEEAVKKAVEDKEVSPGIFEADGTVLKAGKSRYAVRLGSISLNLLKQVQALLLNS